MKPSVLLRIVIDVIIGREISHRYLR